MNPDQSSIATQILQNKKLNGFFNILESDDEKKQTLATKLVSLVDSNSDEIGLSIENATDVESNSIELMKLYRDNSEIEGEKKLKIDNYINSQEELKHVSVDQIKDRFNSKVPAQFNEPFPQKNEEAIKAREERLELLNEYFPKLTQYLAELSDEDEMNAFLSNKKDELLSLINENSENSFESIGQLNFLNSFGEYAVKEVLNEKINSTKEEPVTPVTKILQNKRLNDFFNILASNDEIKQALATQLVSLVDLNRVNGIGLSIENATDVESNSIELMKLYRDNSEIEGEKKQRIDSYIEVQETSKNVSVDQIKAKFDSSNTVQFNEPFPQKNEKAIKAREKRLEQLNKDSDEFKQDLAKFSNEDEMNTFLSKKKDELQKLIEENPLSKKTSEANVSTSRIIELENFSDNVKLDKNKRKLEFLKSFGESTIRELLNEKKINTANDDQIANNSSLQRIAEVAFAPVRMGANVAMAGAKASANASLYAVKTAVKTGAGIAYEMLPKAPPHKQSRIINSLSVFAAVISASLSALPMSEARRPRDCVLPLDANGFCPDIILTTSALLSMPTTSAMSTAPANAFSTMTASTFPALSPTKGLPTSSTALASASTPVALEQTSSTKVEKPDGTTTTTVENKEGITTTTTVVNQDGTTTTTEKKPDGTTTTTVENKEGITTTTTVVNQDGTTTIKVEKPDGTTTTTEKKPDGTTTTIENKDGTTTTTVVNPDGTTTTTTTAIQTLEGTPPPAPSPEPAPSPAPPPAPAPALPAQKIFQTLTLTPTPTPTPIPPESQNGLGVGPIAGITIAALATGAAVAGYVYEVGKRYQENNEGYQGRNAVTSDAIVIDVENQPIGILGFPGAMPAQNTEAMEAAQLSNAPGRSDVAMAAT